MKKNLLIFLACLLPLCTIAQEQGMLDATWYVRYISIDNDVSYSPFDENFNLQFSGSNGAYAADASGVVNSLQGQLLFDAFNETIEFTDVAITPLACDVDNCDFEALYFHEFLTQPTAFLKTFEYDYYENSDGTKMLRLTDAVGNIAFYRDYPIPGPDTELFQTWYLYSEFVDLGGTQYFYGPDVPQITINEDLSFTAIDNCWEISGEFEYMEDSAYDFALITKNYQEDCVLGGSNGYLLKTVLIENYPVGGFLISGAISELELHAAAYFGLGFRNEITLSSPDNNLEEVTLAPNPASDSIAIQGLLDNTAAITIYGVSGSVMRKQQLNVDTLLDISLLETGLYFAEITSNGQTTVEKFIKK
ncbi:MAG: hypothetical protein CMC08_05850 [Flavobacteriaceae bacterium]|nr:hypothetical protein [Flavobacteriaceae bacterium]